MTSLLAAFSRDLARLVAEVMPAVVAVSGRRDGDLYVGSGFLIDRDGHVVTNAHVVEGLKTPISAFVHGGQNHPAALLGVDVLTDLALLRLERPPRASLRLRRSPAALGEICLALGNPCGRYPESVSLGIISGVARTVWQEIGRPIYGSLQTDCATNLGNSGGPLVDAKGQVLGVSVRKDFEAEGVGFAIPADTVADVVAQLKAVGEVRRASLGIRVRRFTPAGGRPSRRGVEVVGVTEKQHDLRVGDLILGVDETPVGDVADLVRLLTGSRVGHLMKLDILRGGKRRVVAVRPQELKAALPGVRS